MEPESPLPHSQVPATCPCHEQFMLCMTPFFRGADSRTADDIVTACRRIVPPFLQFCSVRLKETVCRIFNLTAEWFEQSVATGSTTSALLPVA
jgi:hypothetical protein